MKSYNVDDKLKDRKMIVQAIIKTCKSKRKKNAGTNRKYKEAQYILQHVDEYTDRVLDLMESFEIKAAMEEQGIEVPSDINKMAYSPRKCESFEIKDGSSRKSRTITSVPLYPDQIIHQLIIAVAKPVMMKSMYEYSCGSMPGGGIHKGMRCIKKTIDRHSKNDKSEIKYVAKLDIKKCYPSISHESLKGQLRKKFRGKLFLWLTDSVIDSYFDGDVNGIKHGLPIGYSTSQWFCNFHLTPLDHLIKEKLHIKHYVRYMDDMVFFGPNKKSLHKAVDSIGDYLKSMELKLKDNWQVFRFDYFDKNGNRRGRDIDFLGFRFFRDKIILRKRIALTLKRQAAKIFKSKKLSVRMARSFISRAGWLRHSNSFNFYNKHIKDKINFKKIKEVISNESRKYSNANCAI
jgi:hypothetical protein